MVAALHLRFVMQARTAMDAAAAVVPVAAEMGDVLRAMDLTAEITRTAADRTEQLLHHLDTKITLIATTSLGIAEHAEVVADDLRLTHERADRVSSETPGKAADAAMRSPDPETAHEVP